MGEYKQLMWRDSEQAFGGHVIAGPSGLNEFSLYDAFCSFKSMILLKMHMKCRFCLAFMLCYETESFASV